MLAAPKARPRHKRREAAPGTSIRRPASSAPSPNLKPLRPLPAAPLAGAWTPANPWTDEYLARELASMSWMPEYLKFVDGEQHVLLRHRHSEGIIDAYMRRDFLEWGPFPWLQIDGAVWMSITPLEIESHYMPIFLAEGRVGVGGLGLGYAALRMASKPDVDEVVVYENNPRILRLWERLAPQANPRHVAKITLVDQDVATMRDQSFDFFYNDVYEQLLDNAAVGHWNALTLANELPSYHWWGFEAWLMPWVLERRKHEVPFLYRHLYFPFLKQFVEAVEAGHGMWGIVSNEACFADAKTLHEGIWDV